MLRRTRILPLLAAGLVAGLAGCSSTRLPLEPPIPPSGIVISTGPGPGPEAPARVPDPAVPSPAAGIPPAPVVVPPVTTPSPAPGPIAPGPIASEPEPAPEAGPILSPAPAVTPDLASPAWVDWSDWLAQHGWGPLRVVHHGQETAYEATGSGGIVGVVPGQKRAFWNHTLVQLGFEPHVIQGRVRVHSLDLAANFEPLVAAGPGLRPAQRTVVIDPGHGGANTGTRSLVGNQFEKQFTLDWALRLRVLLEAQGWAVWLTRTNDVERSLQERVDFAEAHGAALFVSLHFNSAFPRQQVAGLETYCLTPPGMASHVVREYADDPSRRFPNNEFDAANLRLAVAVHRSLLATGVYADRGVRRARFMDVLRWQNRPAVLIEGGYLSNPVEARQISRPEFRQRLAEAVAAALP